MDNSGLRENLERASEVLLVKTLKDMTNWLGYCQLVR